MQTLLKRFMDWDIDSSKLSSLLFIKLRWKLLLSYLGVMVAILGTFTGATYHLVTNHLYRKLDRQLASLAQAATHNFRVSDPKPTTLNNQILRTIDDDGDLDIPWQDLREDSQQIEWFNAQGHLLGRAGKNLHQVSWIQINSRLFQSIQDRELRSLTLPVYQSKKLDPQQLVGYIRVSESTEDLSAEIDRLVWGLQWGGAIAIVLSAAGGWWLTRQSVKPIEHSFYQLKQFTADASHELRSPLTAIKTSVDVLQSHPDRIHPSDIKKVAAIASATQQMTRLVEDLLWLARSDDTRLHQLVSWRILSLDELLEDLVIFLMPQIETKKLKIYSKISPDIWVKGDVDLLQRLLSNLLNNALHYTPSGGSIFVELGTTGGMAIVRIQDTGIGLTPAQMKLVFQRFWQADKDRSHHSGSLGLGLSIAQAIARLHHGEITVNSQVNRGSCFQFRLPEVRLKSPHF